jgi:hypothetical protein
LVSRAGRELPQSPIRRQLLEMLMRHMHMLRKVVDGDSVCKLIQTVTGAGYRLRAGHD